MVWLWWEVVSWMLSENPIYLGSQLVRSEDTQHEECDADSQKNEKEHLCYLCSTFRDTAEAK